MASIREEIVVEVSPAKVWAVVRELSVDVDDGARRLVWSATGER